MKLLYARAGAGAIFAALALSPIHAAPKPIVDLSKSPALSGKPAPSAKPMKANSQIAGLDQQTLELGGGAILLFVLGAGAFAISRRRTPEDASWDDEEVIAPEEHDPLFDEPMFRPTQAEASAFSWADSSRAEQEAQADGRRPGETWVERAYRGPSPDNPSCSLRARLKRAAFFDKREREAAAGTAAHVEPGAGLPDADQREFEAA